MPYIIRSRSVGDVCWQQSQMNLFVNKTTTSNSFCPSYTSYSTYVAGSASLREKAQEKWGAVKQSTILSVTLPNVHQF